MRCLFQIILLVVLSSYTVTADDFEDEVLRTMKLTNAIQPTMKLMDQSLATMSPMLIDQMFQQYTDEGKAVKRDEVVELITEWRKRFIERVASKLTPLLTEEYRKFFTLGEIRELNELFEQPVFRAYAAKTPEMMAAVGKAAERLGQQLGGEVLEELTSENPKFQ